MKKWIVVYIDGRSYLCKWYGDHYESEASGKTVDLQRIAEQLNKE